MERPLNKWWFAASVVLALYVLASVSSTLVKGTTLIHTDKIAVIPIMGTITMDHAAGSFFEFETVNTDDLIQKIHDAANDQSVKAILFEINSPGGSAVASKEVADVIKKLNKTNYAVIREVGASGAYWIASATNKIIAQDASITGSVGVISSYLQFGGLLEDYNVTYERLVAGQYKDIGTPLKSLTPEERAILQKKLTTIHAQFLTAVQKNRKLTDAQVTRISTGEFFLGSEALDLGLIDALGSKEDAIAMLKSAIKQEDIQVVEEKQTKGLLSYFTTTGSYYFGRGFAAAFTPSEKARATITT